MFGAMITERACCLMILRTTNSPSISEHKSIMRANKPQVREGVIDVHPVDTNKQSRI